MIRLIVLFGILLLLKLGLSVTAEQLNSSALDINQDSDDSVDYADFDFQN